jgi:hypothetical protein
MGTNIQGYLFPLQTRLAAMNEDRLNTAAQFKMVFCQFNRVSSMGWWLLCVARVNSG